MSSVSPSRSLAHSLVAFALSLHSLSLSRSLPLLFAVRLIGAHICVRPESVLKISSKTQSPFDHGFVAQALTLSRSLSLFRMPHVGHGDGATVRMYVCVWETRRRLQRHTF